MRFGIGCGELNSASSTGVWVAITELKLELCAASSCLVGDGRETGSTVDGDSVSKVEDDRRLSPEGGEKDSHQLESSSSMGSGEGGYSSAMAASEFDCVAWMVFATASRANKEAGPTCSRAEVDDVDCGRFSVAEEVGCGTPSVAKDADSTSHPLANVFDSAACSVVVVEIDSVSGAEVEDLISTSRVEVDKIEPA